MAKTHTQRRTTQEPEIIEELNWPDLEVARLACGPRDRHLRSVEQRYRVTIHPRGNRLRVMGPRSAVADALSTLGRIYEHARRRNEMDAVTVERLLYGDPSEEAPTEEGDAGETILISYRNRRLGPRTEGQRRYVDAIRHHAITFGIGPAGTGKTYLAVLMGVQQLLAGQVQRMILTRPAVEAGERLGFLPGDLAEKVNPYLRPLYDALHDMLPFDRVRQMIETDVIEVAPLAFMRGRTLANAFVILDEAQNTTQEQMKMFLTRVGEGSRVVVTGDPTQTDLPSDRPSGLDQALAVLHEVPEIAIVTFTEADVLRHSVVQRILDAYARSEASARQAALPEPVHPDAVDPEPGP